MLSNALRNQYKQKMFQVAVIPREQKTAIHVYIHRLALSKQEP